LPPVETDLVIVPSPATVQLASHEVLVAPTDSPPSNRVEEIPSPGEAETAPQSCLTLVDFEAMALGQNPAVAEAAARVNALRGNYVQVGLPPNPTAGYTASEIGDSGKAGQQGAFIGQQIVTGHKLTLNRAVASREVQQAQQRLAMTQQQVQTDVRIAFYEVLIAQQRLAVTEKMYAVGQQGLHAVEALLKAQEAAGTDLLQSKIEANTAQMFVENARAARYGAWLRLTSIVGAPGLPLADVAGNVADDLPSIEFDAALDQILASSPQLAAAYSNIERARWAVQRARAEVVPDVNLQGTVQFDYGTDTTIAGAQLGMALPIINRNQGGIYQARAELSAAAQAANRLELALRKRLAEVYQRYQMARQQVDRYAADILPPADETLRLTTEGYQAGEFGYLQLLTAQRTYFQTNLSYLDALGRMWAASREIEGLLLSGSLEAGTAAGSNTGSGA
jgi:cobalt-zinc-cadmium efflux system outer membrane protein